MKVILVIFVLFRLSSSVVATQKDVFTSRHLNLRKLDDAETVESSIEEKYSTVSEEGEFEGQEETLADVDHTDDAVEQKSAESEEQQYEFNEDENFDTSYASSKTDDLAETGLEQAEEVFYANQGEDVNEEFEEQTEQSYTMTYSSNSNTSSILALMGIFSIVGMIALKLKRKLFHAKSSTDFYRMEDDDTISALA